MTAPHPPLLAITAFSGTGKTTLLTQLIPLLNHYGVRIGIIKHTHHKVDVDTPGKDSYELRKAGARQTMVASEARWALMTENQDLAMPSLSWLAEQMDATQIDLILVEGFKHEPITKIALFRQQTGVEWRSLIDEHVIAVASDVPLDITLPLLDINQPEAIAHFINEWLHHRQDCRTPPHIDGMR
ncbi:molybdopterin-guanine dinucleotide biosynthesis protein MobB [Acerihabitans sp. TG2]|uniref:molybdopterin-guanine dinucleotide biosynthesis protein MobB n=1 Tax=Acerihabitans sp. TG2 TaxID=3096008 RepID=UPI002B233C17|nr:molybdopterin-guanine dinucleotide biosynthesis protein MobB [Acerihabitans sp. TG2]MEA9392408.1 molybdopterin-guanine dinucleotide biosynthesis protein MobB [Acerihabitans sp. TG2]